MITADTVKNIASLARLHLQDTEVAKLTANLEDILHYIAKLEKLDVKNIHPTSHVLPLKNVFRSDDVRPSLSQEKALSFAIEKSGGSYRVPLVIE